MPARADDLTRREMEALEQLAEGRARHAVEHLDLGETFEAPEGLAILDAGLAAGLDMDHGCRVGACGACAVEVCEGLENVDDPDPIEADSLGRFATPPDVRLACRASIRGPVKIRQA